MTPRQQPLLPLSQGSERLQSPPGETLIEFYFRFMERKLLKTGWKSGRAQQQDVRRPDRTPLQRPFISLFEAMMEAGFIETWQEGVEALERLAAGDSRVGIGRKGSIVRYWLQPEAKTSEPADF